MNLKNFGPKLEQLDINSVLKQSEDTIINKLNPIYELIKTTSKEKIFETKDLIGFVGATWTIFIYMMNKQSPKNKLDKEIFNHPKHEELINKIIKTQKIHIKKQVENGASIIQIFDSWAGILDNEKKFKYIYKPTKEVVEFAKKLGATVICFPRGIESYEEFCDIVKPDAINIDYEIDPIRISKNINIPIQGGMDPKNLLLEQNEMLKNARKYLEIFKNNKYIFNLGHGIMPETNPANVKVLVDFVKGFK